MVRMKLLRNYPVVLKEKQIGLLQSIRFDQARKRVCALVVSCGMHGKQIVSSEHICTIAEGFILADEIRRKRHELPQQIFPFVRDTTGMLVGRVTDYAIDRKTLSILAIEIIPGYSPTENKSRIWMYEYCNSKNADEIIIPGILQGMPSLLREEDGVCAYQR